VLFDGMLDLGISWIEWEELTVKMMDAGMDRLDDSA